MADILITYAEEDSAAAQAVCDELEQRGLKCWLRDRDVSAGQHWATATMKALSSAVAVVVIFTDGANDSSHIRRDVEHADRKGLSLIPYRIAASPVSDFFEYFFGQSAWIDASADPKFSDLAYAIGAATDKGVPSQTAAVPSVSTQPEPELDRETDETVQVEPQQEVEPTDWDSEVSSLWTESAEPEATVTLSVIEGPNEGREYTFQGHDTFVVGRSPKAHFRLPENDRYFSRFHFMVEVNPPLCRLSDMGSRNGTFVNDEKVATYDLNDGDAIRGGKTLLQVSAKNLRPKSEFAALAEEVSETPLTTSKDSAFEIVSPSREEPSPRKLFDNPYEIGNYRILERIHQGSLGPVFKAEHIESGELAVLKTVDAAAAASGQDIAKFLGNVEGLLQLKHPNIVPYREADVISAGGLFIALEFIEGINVESLVKRNGPLPIDRAAGLVCQLLRGLQYAHDLGVCHRNIKPSNILIQTSGGQGKALLSDFGLARVYQASQMSGLTMMKDVSGSGPFIAPEQITDYRRAQPQADIYAIASVLYYLLTDCHALELPDRVELQLAMILSEKPTPITDRRKDIPRKLAKAIHKGLESEPRARFKNANAMRKALVPFV